MEPFTPLMKLSYEPSSRVLFVGCILFIPVFDTFRVILLRLLKGDSPFSADKEHAHHIMLDLGLSHKRASFYLFGLNLLVILTFAIFYNKLTNLWLTLLVVAMYGGMFLLFYYLKKKSIVLLGIKKAEDMSLKTGNETSKVDEKEKVNYN